MEWNAHLRNLYGQGYPPALLHESASFGAGMPLPGSPHPDLPHQQTSAHFLHPYTAQSDLYPGHQLHTFTGTPQIYTDNGLAPPAYAASPSLPPASPFGHHGTAPTTAIMQNNPQQQPAQMPGQINMNALVRAQHIQNLPNLTIQQKNQLVSAVSQCSSVVQNSPPGSEQYMRALQQWQNITQRYMQARNAAAKMAQGGGGAGGGGGGPAGAQNPQGAPAGGQQQGAMQPGNMGQQQAGMQAAGQVPQGGGVPQQQQQPGGGGAPQQGGGQQPPPGMPPIPKQIMDYVNSYTYYHPSGIGPGHPKYEEYRQDVKFKHAKILLDNEKNKQELKKVRLRIEQMKQQGQEIPPALEEVQRNVEQKTNDLGAQLTKWTQNQKAFKEKYEQARAAQGGNMQQGQPSDAAGPAQGSQASPVAGPQQGNQNRPGGAMSPGVPAPQAQGMPNQQANNNFAQSAGSGGGPPQQTPQSATGPPQSQQRPSISGQQPQMPNMPQPNPQQSAQQSGNPTPLSHQQALQRAYSGGTPQSAGAGGPSQPPPASHSQPYAGGQAPPRETSTTSSSNMNPSAKLMTSKAISPSLSQPPAPVQNFPQSRPTMAGPANGVGGIMGQPALTKPTFSLENTESGGVLSKKKLDELVRQVTGGGEGMGGEMLTPEVEEAILMVADEFVDNVITAACKLAKLRDNSTLDVRDIQLILERNYNIRIPGFASDELRAIRKFAPAPGWTAKMNAIQAAKVMGGKTDL